MVLSESVRVGVYGVYMGLGEGVRVCAWGWVRVCGGVHGAG